MPATENTEIAELVADVRERLVYMRELGVESLDAKVGSALVSSSATQSIPPPEILASEPASARVGPTPSNLKSEISNSSKAFNTETVREPAPKPGESRLASLPSLTNRKSGFFDKYNPEDKSTEKTIVPNQATQLFETSPQLPEPVETVEQIRAEIGPDCMRCPLGSQGRRQVVNSVGDFNARLMFVGEAPGADEDEQGFPFVGRAGKLLTDIIAAIGFKREDVFIGNINRCRPPGNRAPIPVETETCRPFLLREVAVVRPRVIVVLGNTATQNLLDIKTPISKLRGNFQDYFGVKVMPTFHPAYLLRDPHKKREVWEDMKMVRDYLRNK